MKVAPAAEASAAQLVAIRLAKLEGLGNRERPVPEVRLRPHKLDLDAFFDERAQRQSGLQRCDTSSGDDDPCRHHDLPAEAACCSIPFIASILRSRA